jgi:hypothetical protein
MKSKRGVLEIEANSYLMAKQRPRVWRDQGIKKKVTLV